MRDTARLPPILLLGGGRMGAALLAGWRQRGLSPSVIVDPASSAQHLAGGGVTVVTDASLIPAGFLPDAVILAVKPQAAADAVPRIRMQCGGVVLSIMAGQTMATLARLTQATAIVRAMPNTPAAIGQGFTGAFAGPGVSAAHRTLSDDLLAAVGEVAWLDAEAQLDAVTATSGSGPAYVFLLTELIAAAAIEQGLPDALAQRLARRTVAGSGALLAASTDTPAAMRRAVTSPGGTTERALAVLMASDAWPAAVSRAIAAAANRSRELAG